MKSKSVARTALMSGASLVAMIMGSSLRAQAAGTTIANTTVPSVSVTAGQAFDFILIDNSTVLGDVTNSGTVGGSLGGEPIVDDAIVIRDGSTVGGRLINNSGGTVFASERAVAISDSIITEGIENAGIMVVSAPAPLDSGQVIAGISVTGAAVSTGIENSGSLAVNAAGGGRQGNFNNTLPAVIGIYVSGTSAVTADIDNSGTISVSADYANDSGSAAARATGIGVFGGPGGVSGDVSTTNSGDLRVVALASGTTASAHAYGVDVTVSSLPGDLELGFVNTSSGTISITASATGSDADAVAGAIYHGLYFSSADGAKTSSSIISNDGTISIIANASAHGSNADASANANYGVWQSLGTSVSDQSGPVADTASASFTNSSDLSLTAGASAEGSSAVAQAYASYAVFQYAHGVSEAAAYIDNSGAITVVADAQATGGGASTAATATIRSAIGQAVAVGFGMSAAAGVTNDGTMDFLARAYAIGESSANADANIKTGIVQRLTYGDESTASVTNSASINFAAVALADFSFSGTSAAVAADAYVRRAIYQKALGGSVSDIGSVSIANSGELDVGAYALALGTGSIEANAEIFKAVEQRAQDYHESYATLTNSGDIEIIADAYALGTSDVNANAYIWGSNNGYTSGGAIYQRAFAVRGADIADAGLMNDGTLHFQARAIAGGFNNPVPEIFDTAAFGTATFDTSAFGTTTFATYTGSSVAQYAEASAAIERAIFQDARYAKKTFAKLTNSGIISIGAHAEANGTSGADANAFVKTAVYQGAYKGDENYVSLNNTGTVDVLAEARARGYASVSADASVYGVFYQSAYAYDGAMVADASLTNGGTLNIKADASATGVISVFAAADVKQAISQYAYYGAQSSVHLSNSGMLNIVATAWAGGWPSTATEAERSGSSAAWSADASASVHTVIYQDAYGNGVAGDVASVNLTNAGGLSLNIGATAAASGLFAEADAAYSRVIYQRAKEADEVSVVIDNSGFLSISAYAGAAGVSQAVAAAAAASPSSSYSSYSSYYDVSDAVINQMATPAEGGVSALASISNSGTLTIGQIAVASAESGTATAYAWHHNGMIYQGAVDAVTNAVDLTNSGTFAISRSATAKGESGANAHIYNEYSELGAMLEQHASGGSLADILLTNSGEFLIEAKALAIAASGGAWATVSEGNPDPWISQYALQADEARAGIENSGSFYLTADAMAMGDEEAVAVAYYSRQLVVQYAETDENGAAARATISNDGTFVISADAAATAQAGGLASASAFAYTVIWQGSYDSDKALASITNSGAMTVSKTAYAKVAGTSGTANAYAEFIHGILQKADAGGTGEAKAVVDNSGTLSLENIARAVAGDSAAASAYVSGSLTLYDVFGAIYQSAANGDTVLASVNNSGTLRLTADAQAEAFNASAYAYAPSIVQSVGAVSGGEATASFENSSSFAVSALAKALGQHDSQTTETAQAKALASAYGVSQNVANGGDPTATLKFANSGDFSVIADAMASATAGTAANEVRAMAYAQGYKGHAPYEYTTTNHPHFGELTLPSFAYIADVAFDNSGIFRVAAYARGSGAGTFGAGATGVEYNAAAMIGTFTNAGNLLVEASAPGGTATAYGLRILTDSLQTEFTNSGSIRVKAIGAQQQATAVYFNDFIGDGSPLGTFTNDGGVIMAIRNDGSDGAQDTHGHAFMAEEADYSVLLSWQGNDADGYIFGDVDIKLYDLIEVTNGTTFYDGTINPDSSEDEEGEENPEIAAASLSLLQGSLDIFDNGKLVLVNNADLGPSQVNVNEFTVQSDGTLGIQIDPQLASSIDTLTASLAGTIMISAVAGLYASSQTYQDVIEAGTRNGNFDNEMSHTPLLDLAVVYDDYDNVDFLVTRNAFDAVPGLTRNQRAVAGAIESSYSTTLAGEYGALVGELFTLDGNDYPDALDQLSGVEYAGALQAAAGSFNQFLDAVNQRVKGAHGAGSSTNAYPLPFAGGPNDQNSGWWFRVQGGWADQDGDGNASGYSYSEVTTLMGLDGQAGDNLLVGIAVGLYAPGDLDFDNGNTVNQDAGYQVGAYAQFDPGQYYLRGFVGYGAWRGEAVRTISIGSLSGVNSGTFDVSAWNVSGEAGFDLIKEASLTVTPFGGLSYTRASLGNFTETGFAASALSGGGDGNQFDGYAGLRLWGMAYKGGNATIMPEIAAGYVYNFSDEATVTNTLTAAPSGTSNFTIYGPKHGGAGFLDVNAAMYVRSNAQFKFGYLGEYGSTHQEHSAFGKFKMNF